MTLSESSSAVSEAAVAGGVSRTASVGGGDYDASGVGGGTPRVRGPVCVQQGGQDYTLTCREPSLQGGGFHVCSPSVTMIRRK